MTDATTSVTHRIERERDVMPDADYVALLATALATSSDDTHTHSTHVLHA